MKIIIPPLMLCLSLPAVAQAEGANLRFEHTVIALAGDGTEDSLAATFRFVNSGSAPVRILAVRPDCGCTTTELTKDVYAPGEKGELRALLRTAGLNGRTSKDIVVESDEAADNRYTVTLRAEIREPVTVTPRLLYWLVEEKTAPKTITVKYAGAKAVRLVEVRPSGNLFQVSQADTTNESEIILKAAPAETAKAGQAELSLVFQNSAGHTIERKVSLRVFDKPAGVAPLLKPTAKP